MVNEYMYVCGVRDKESNDRRDVQYCRDDFASSSYKREAPRGAREKKILLVKVCASILLSVCLPVHGPLPATGGLPVFCDYGKNFGKGITPNLSHRSHRSQLKKSHRSHRSNRSNRSHRISRQDSKLW